MERERKGKSKYSRGRKACEKWVEKLIDKGVKRIKASLTKGLNA